MQHIAKAIAGFITTFILTALTQIGITEDMTVAEGIATAVNALVAALAVGYTVWYVPNK